MPKPMQNLIRATIVSIFVGGVMSGSLSGCSLFRVYRIDIPQGSPLTKAQAAQVRVGMTQSQVRYLLGSPTLTDTLNPNVWDYQYAYRPGTYARKLNIQPVNDQHLRIHFDTNAKVSLIEGMDTLPDSQIGLPPAKITPVLPIVSPAAPVGQ